MFYLFLGVLGVAVLVIILDQIKFHSQPKSNPPKVTPLKEHRETPPAIIDAVPETFVVFDVETTGLDPMEQEIIEIAAIRAHTNQAEQQTYTALVKPSKPICKKITDLTGITNEMVEKDGIPLDKALEEFREFIGTDKLVAYNAEFDKRFINCAAERLGKKPIVKGVTCAYKKARAAWPDLENHKLCNVAKLAGLKTMVGLSIDGNHRALEDCKRALMVYVNAAQIVKNKYRRAKKVISVLLVSLALSGCASHIENVHPEWNPAGGFDEASAKCNASSKYAWHRYGTYIQCMAAYGYERKSGPKTEELR